MFCLKLQEMPKVSITAVSYELIILKRSQTNSSWGRVNLINFKASSLEDVHSVEIRAVSSDSAGWLT